MDERRVLIDREPPLTVLTLHEPDKRNPFSPRLVGELTAALEDIAVDEDIVVAVFTGAGPAFSGGADLREMRRATPLEDRGEYDRILALNRLVWSYPKVTICAVNGPALGLGANLVGWADMAVADERATFGFPEVKAGIASATVIPALLRLIGRKAMNELIYTGRAISAGEACRLGLVNRVVSAGTALEHAKTLAHEVATNAHHGLAFTKEVVRVATDMEYTKALEYARDIRVLSRLHPSFQARIDGHLARRGRPEKD